MRRRPAILSLLLVASAAPGCQQRDDDIDARRAQPQAASVIVVAPVINLSDRYDIDTLQVTDWVASEFVATGQTAVVPVNITLAALARQGLDRVETEADARALAQELRADATVVVALTEYDPYDPPRVGLVLQWYGQPREPLTTLDPVSASRQAAALAAIGGPAGEPTWQIQKVFDAADQRVLREVQDYARRRSGAASPYAWRKFAKSQELFVRYCAWSSIRTMLRVLHEEH